MNQGLVLIVDPDATARQRSEVVLARAGLNVVSTADGTGALRMASRMQPDEVLTEIVLPTIDGFNLARRLRAEERTRHIGIVALTDYDGDDLQQRASESGIDRVVRKSWATAEMVRVVRSTLLTALEGRQRLARACVGLQNEIERHIGRRAQFHDIATELREIREQIDSQFGLGRPDASMDGVLAEADGARDVMLVDRQRGEELFRLLFERLPNQPLLHFKRGEAYRAMGRRKLAHEDFAKAFELFPPGDWRDRARIAAMRTRSHHEPGW